MLYIDYNMKRGGITETKTLNWHRGEKLPNIPGFFIENVVSVQADGDELDFICHLGLLCSPKKRVISLYGDLARTVVLNIPRE